jgi:hypothetical protein
MLAQNELAAGKTAEAQEINGRRQIEQWRWCIQVIVEHRLDHAHESQRILNELIEKYGQSSPNLIATAYAPNPAPRFNAVVPGDAALRGAARRLNDYFCELIGTAGLSRGSSSPCTGAITSG